MKANGMNCIREFENATSASGAGPGTASALLPAVQRDLIVMGTDGQPSPLCDCH